MNTDSVLNSSILYTQNFLVSSGKFHSCLFSRNQLQILTSAIRSSNNGIRKDEDYFSSSSWKAFCVYSCILLTELAVNTETSSVTISEKQLRRNDSDISQQWYLLHEKCSSASELCVGKSSYSMKNSEESHTHITIISPSTQVLKLLRWQFDGNICRLFHHTLTYTYFCFIG